MVTISDEPANATDDATRAAAQAPVACGFTTWEPFASVVLCDNGLPVEAAVRRRSYGRWWHVSPAGESRQIRHLGERSACPYNPTHK